MPLIDITPPGNEPLTLAEVKDEAHIDGAEFDARIPRLIAGMRRQAEARTGRRLITQTVELVLDAFPCGDIDLQLPNVQSITSVKYLDGDGVEQTLSNTVYSLDKDSTPCVLFLAYGQSWPTTRDQRNAVRVRFVVGYGNSAANVPEDIRMWMLAYIVQVLQGPDGLAPDNLQPLPFVDALLDYHRVYRVA